MKPCKEKQPKRLACIAEALLARIPSISHHVDPIPLLAYPSPERVILLRNGELQDLSRLLVSSQQLRIESPLSVCMTLEGNSLLVRLEESAMELES